MYVKEASNYVSPRENKRKYNGEFAAEKIVKNMLSLYSNLFPPSLKNFLESDADDLKKWQKMFKWIVRIRLQY
jgi:hypothetical protein